MSNYLSHSKRKLVFHLLCEGNGIRGTSRLAGVGQQTVSDLMGRFCSIIEYLNRQYIADLSIDEIEADEIRTFVRVKTNIKWIYIALDRKSRMVIHSHVGKRDHKDAKLFLTGLSKKLNKKSSVNTDCLASYVSAVAKTPNGRIEAATASIGLFRSAHLGKPLMHITNRIETHNGNVRQHVSRLTRRTRCFSKKVEFLKKHLTLFFFYYNFIKTHKSIKKAPCLEAGVIKQKFILDDLIEYDTLINQTTGNKRGRYKPRKLAKVVPIYQKKDRLSKMQKKSREKWEYGLRIGAL